MPNNNLESDTFLEYSPCPMGCAANDDFVFRGGDTLYGLPGEFSVVRCCQCGLFRVDPRPSLDGMKSYYPENYIPFSAVTKPDNKGNRGWPFSNTIKGLFDFKDHLRPLSQPGRLLEIGCGSGAFLQVMAGQGWTVQGIEPSTHAAELANNAGFPVYCGLLDDFHWDGEPYDLCVGWMVLEHLHNPVEVLKLISPMVKKGGCLCLSVPNAGSWEFKVFKDSWYAAQLPNHLYHFTPQTLTNLLGISGWDVTQLVHQRNITNIPLSIWLRAKKLRGGQHRPAPASFLGLDVHKWNYLLYPIAFALSNIKQGGRLSIVCQKAD